MNKPKIEQQDRLRSILEEVREYLQKEGFVIFYGIDSGESPNRTYWNREAGGDWKAFLQCAQTLGAKPIYFFSHEFGDFDLQELFDEDEQATFANHVGQICAIELSFHCNGFIHSYHDVAEWYQEFEALSDSEIDLDEDDEDLNDRPF